MNDDFYIGYETPVPASSRRRVFGAAATALAIMLAAGALLLASQSRLPAASFGYGTAAPYAGVIRLTPYPALETPDGVIWLVGAGKHGARDIVRAFDGRSVRLLGAPIERGSHRMVEVVADSVTTSEPAASEIRAPGPSPTDLGEMTVTGEIVDSKCYLGVMNPGEGAAHRDCARACLRGGLPPMFAVRTTDGREVLFVLTDETGDALTPDAASRATLLAGKPITLTGRAFFTPDTRLWSLRVKLIEPRS